MTSRSGPIVFDENGRAVVAPSSTEAEKKQDGGETSMGGNNGQAQKRAPAGPAIFETDTETTKIDGWIPAVRRPVGQTRPSAFPFLATGLGVILGGSIAIYAASFLVQRFADSTLLGIAAVAVYVVGFGLVGVWSAREWRAFSALDAIDEYRQALAKDTSVEKSRAVALRLIVRSVLPESVASEARNRVERADSQTEISEILKRDIFADLDSAAQAAIIRSTARLAALVTLSPSPLGDTVIFAVRAVALIREIAEIYGLRPTNLSTLKLARRILTSASLVAAADVAVTTAVHAFSTNPLVQMAVGDAAGAAVAAQRMYRIGRIAMAECSPI